MSTFNLILTIIGGIIGIQVELVLLVKWLTKHYLKELIPNSGTSMKDQINRLEARQHEIYRHFMEKDK
jgi:uncharacterized membrane-anchored protein YhcB (DUF1043 family)